VTEFGLTTTAAATVLDESIERFKLRNWRGEPWGSLGLRGGRERITRWTGF
jgi:hypothetical protein